MPVAPCFFLREFNTFRSLAAALVPFEAQSLLSHAPYLFIKFRFFFIAPRAFRFRRIAPTQFFKRLLDGKFVDFSHAISSSQPGVRPRWRIVASVAADIGNRMTAKPVLTSPL